MERAYIRYVAPIADDAAAHGYDLDETDEAWLAARRAKVCPLPTLNSGAESRLEGAALGRLCRRVQVLHCHVSRRCRCPNEWALLWNTHSHYCKWRSRVCRGCRR